MMFLEQNIEGMTYRFLGKRKPRTLRIGGVAHKSQHAFFTDLGKASQINRISKDGCVIHLEIAGMHHNAGRRINRQRRRIHNRMVRPDEFYPKTTEVNGRTEFHHLPLGAVEKILFLQLVIDNPHGQPGCIDRHIHLLQDIGQCADMVLMTVGDDKALHLVNIVRKVSNIRDHEVDPQHIILRKSQTAVHNNNTVFIAKGSNVHPNLLESAKRYDLQLGMVILFFLVIQKSLLHFIT